MCVANRRGAPKYEIAGARLTSKRGIEGDVHAGAWHRHVGLPARRSIEQVRAVGLNSKPGAFRENFVVDGVNIDERGVGTQLHVGSALLELTQVGKACHT